MKESLFDTGYEGEVIIDTNIFMGCTHREDFIADFEENNLKMVTTIEVIRELDHLKTKEGRAGYEARKGIKFVEYLKENDLLEIIYSPEDNGDTGEKISGYADKAIIESAKNFNKPVLSNDLSLRVLVNAYSSKNNNCKAYAYEHTNKTKLLNSSVLHIDYQDFIESPKGAGFSFNRDEFFNSPDVVLPCLGKTIENGQYVVLEYFSPKDFKCYTKENGTLVPLVKNISFPSNQFKTVSPKSNDVHQACLFDSLHRNDLTLVTGPAGTGKTFISLAYIFNQLETNVIDRIVIFVNPEETRDGAKLGYYKGDMINKLLQKSLGGILESKLGSRDYVDRMIQDEQIILKSVNDIRGYEVPDNSLLYITEAQNMTIELMKLSLQRAGNNTQVIVEGDPETQLDGYIYEGYNNGMIKLLEVFSGEDSFGHVNLNKIYRSKIAEIADKMTI